MRFNNGPLLLISNPKSGDGQGPAFVNKHVLPLLAHHGISIHRQIVTTAPGHAAAEFLSFVQEHNQATQIFLVLASGDGTLHEIVNAAYNASFDRSLQVSVALIPTGTANAIYSSFFSSVLPRLQAGDISSADYMLLSVRTMLANSDNTAPLTITKSTVWSPSRTIVAVHFSAVVTSTALHASILRDSESLREQIPDLSRFKVAAQNNITRWYSGTVNFRPRVGDQVTIYDHRSGQFVPFIGDDHGASEPIMYGPFAYFLSTVNVDRLEPSFVISPLHSRIRPNVDAMDIIVVRPHRDPTIPRESDSKGDHLRFAEKVGLALRAAYKDGAHVNLDYLEDGTIHEGVEPNGVRSLVEYIRCTGRWRWINTGLEIAHLCVDGTIIDIEAHGEAECEVIESSALKFGIIV